MKTGVSPVRGVHPRAADGGAVPHRICCPELIDPALEVVGPVQVKPWYTKAGPPVSWSDWLVIDQAEIERGEPKGKPREKFTRVEEMLGLLERPS